MSVSVSVGVGVSPARARPPACRRAVPLQLAARRMVGNKRGERALSAARAPNVCTSCARTRTRPLARLCVWCAPPRQVRQAQHLCATRAQHAELYGQALRTQATFAVEHTGNGAGRRRGYASSSGCAQRGYLHGWGTGLSGLGPVPSLRVHPARRANRTAVAHQVPMKRQGWQRGALNIGTWACLIVCCCGARADVCL